MSGPPGNPPPNGRFDSRMQGGGGAGYGTGRSGFQQTPPGNSHGGGNNSRIGRNNGGFGQNGGGRFAHGGGGGQFGRGGYGGHFNPVLNRGGGAGGFQGFQQMHPPIRHHGLPHHGFGQDIRGYRGGQYGGRGGGNFRGGGRNSRHWGGSNHNRPDRRPRGEKRRRQTHLNVDEWVPLSWWLDVALADPWQTLTQRVLGERRSHEVPRADARVDGEPLIHDSQ